MTRLPCYVAACSYCDAPLSADSGGPYCDECLGTFYGSHPCPACGAKVAGWPDACGACGASQDDITPQWGRAVT